MVSLTGQCWGWGGWAEGQVQERKAGEGLWSEDVRGPCCPLRTERAPPDVGAVGNLGNLAAKSAHRQAAAKRGEGPLSLTHTAAAWSVAVVITPPRRLRLPNSRTSSETTALTRARAGIEQRASAALVSR